MRKPSNNALTTQPQVDAFVAQTLRIGRELDRMCAVADAHIAKANPIIFSVKRRQQAFNDAVAAGIVFG